MITYEVTFRNGKNLQLGPFSGRNEIIEKMLDTTRKSGMASEWKISVQAEIPKGGGTRMGTVDSIRKSSQYLAWRRYEKERDRKFRKAMAIVLIAGGILAVAVWWILF